MSRDVRVTAAVARTQDTADGVAYSLGSLEPVCVDIEVAAELLGLAASTVRELCLRTDSGKPGGLPMVRFGRRILVPLGPLREAVAAQALWPPGLPRLTGGDERRTA